MGGETGLIRVKQDGSRWAAVESWWRCTGMRRTEGMVFPCNHVMHREAGHPLIDCNQCYDKDREWEPVAVRPIAELEALREATRLLTNIPETLADWGRLRRIEARLMKVIVNAAIPLETLMGDTRGIGPVLQAEIKNAVMMIREAVKGGA